MKAQAHHLDPHQLGKHEITPELIASLDKSLTAHELIKIHVMRAVTTSLNELALDLAGPLKADIIQIIGKNIVLYRVNPKDRKIKFPA